MRSPIEIIQYTPEYQLRWNQFIKESKNATFLFYRGYMDYHSLRFTDYSLLFYQKGKLEAVLPANAEKNILYSHGGLTYGGLLLKAESKMTLVSRIFEALIGFLKEKGFHRFVYKPIPYIYHQAPSQEDLYCLFHLGATLCQRDVSSTIDLQRRITYSKNRLEGVKKSALEEVSLLRSFDFNRFMKIQEQILEKKYKTKPTHTVEEIVNLAEKFPHNIKLYAGMYNNAMVAGTIIYETNEVAHTQYIAQTDEGKEKGASILLFDCLIRQYSSRKKYFDFGISTEKMGRYLNEGLVQYKESYGARTVVYDTYEIKL
jgi:hypothetical protein